MFISQLNCSINQAAFIAKVQHLNLDAIAYQLAHSDETSHWNTEQISEAIAAYKQFLFLLYCYPNQTIVPTTTIDRVWHHHILDTQKYAEDCQFLFNRFIHHFPYFGVRGTSDRQAWQVAVKQSQALFQEHSSIQSVLDSASVHFTDCQPLRTCSNTARPQLSLL